MGQKVIDAPFAIAGGNTVMLPVTDAGAIPAEDRKAKIEVAGFIVTRSENEPKLAMIVWNFGLTNKSIKNIESVTVAEVAPAELETPLINDTAPNLVKRYWVGATPPVAATRESVPWLFKEGSTIFVFRFTISEPGKKPHVYLQPAWFSNEVKTHFREVIARINGG
ncbi:MAG: hypothetical protein ABI821_15235 [Pseudomonadota bacterium]